MFPNHVTSIPETNPSNNHIKTKHNPTNNQRKTPEDWKREQDSSLPASTKRPHDYDSDVLSMLWELTSLHSIPQIVTCPDELSNNANKIRRIEELKTEGNNLFNKISATAAYTRPYARAVDHRHPIGWGRETLRDWPNEFTHTFLIFLSF